MLSTLFEAVQDTLDGILGSQGKGTDSGTQKQDSTFQSCPNCKKNFFGDELTTCPQCGSPLEPIQNGTR